MREQLAEGEEPEWYEAIAAWRSRGVASWLSRTTGSWRWQLHWWRQASRMVTLGGRERRNLLDLSLLSEVKGRLGNRHQCSAEQTILSPWPQAMPRRSNPCRKHGMAAKDKKVLLLDVPNVEAPKIEEMKWVGAAQSDIKERLPLPAQEFESWQRRTRWQLRRRPWMRLRRRLRKVWEEVDVITVFARMSPQGKARIIRSVRDHRTAMSSWLAMVAMLEL